MHDFVAANENMACSPRRDTTTNAFAKNVGDGDRPGKMQTLPEALEWLWK